MPIPQSKRRLLRPLNPSGWGVGGGIRLFGDDLRALGGVLKLEFVEEVISGLPLAAIEDGETCQILRVGLVGEVERE